LLAINLVNLDRRAGLPPFPVAGVAKFSITHKKWLHSVSVPDSQRHNDEFISALAAATRQIGQEAPKPLRRPDSNS
jgi:hypothetical protein